MNDRAIYTVANATDLPIADKSVHMIATSPPYFGLRSYDTGDNKHAELGAEKVHDCLAWARGDEPCGVCYVCNMRTWAREMWRVLRDDGTFWLNLGDSYASNGGPEPAQTKWQVNGASATQNGGKSRRAAGGLKPKDLTGIPWRVALALQADGWWLRSDIIWAKPNPMPESVTDRPTKAHEYIFLLTKSARYFWDAEAVREAYAMSSWTAESDKAGTTKRGKAGIRSGDKGNARANGAADGTRYGETSFMNAYHQSGRNIRTVWNVATAPYSGAHYATWPPALVERMIKAGSKPGDVVLDPFAGSGTTLMVARQLGRIGLGFDLSYTYLYDNARTRLGHDKLAAWGNGIKDNGSHADLPLFATMEAD